MNWNCCRRTGFWPCCGAIGAPMDDDAFGLTLADDAAQRPGNDHFRRQSSFGHFHFYLDLGRRDSPGYDYCFYTNGLPQHNYNHYDYYRNLCCCCCWRQTDSFAVVAAAAAARNDIVMADDGTGLGFAIG